MSQEAVERLLGRLITDERFRSSAAESLEVVCLREGYSLSSEELSIMSGLDLGCVGEVSGRLDPRLCRAGAASGQNPTR